MSQNEDATLLALNWQFIDSSGFQSYLTRARTGGGVFFCVSEAEVACESGSGVRIPRDYGCGCYGSYTVSSEHRLNPKKDVSMTANSKDWRSTYLSEHWRQISIISADCMLTQRLCTHRRRKPISGSFNVFMHFRKLKKKKGGICTLHSSDCVLSNPIKTLWKPFKAISLDMAQRGGRCACLP